MLLSLLAGAAAAAALLRGGYAFAGRDLSWYADPGPPGAPVLVLLEGDGSRCQPYRAGLWEGFLAENAGDYALVRPVALANARCGRRDWRRSDLDDRVEETARIVASLREAGLGGPLVLVGHSAGAKVAVRYAAERGGVAGVVSLAGGLDNLAATLRLELAQREADGRLDPAEREAARAEVESALARAAASAPDERMWRRTAGFWQQMMFTDYEALWRSLDVPVLVLHGAEDRGASPVLGFERAQGAFAGEPGVEFVLLPGLGHDLLRPEAFAAIGAWLGRAGVRI